MSEPRILDQLPASDELADDPLGVARKQAAGLLAVGLTPDEVAIHLARQGMDPDLVTKVVMRSQGAAMLHRPQPQPVPEGRKEMIRGGLWCGGGLLVTLISYLAAGPGGTYMFASGAIAFGAFQLFRGWRKAI